IGVVSTLESPYWIGRDEIASLNVTHTKLIWPNLRDTQAPAPRPALASAAISAVFPARPVLRVIEGGRVA
ncbi:hypothetical protein, partial [Stenotrophomonas maltophilia]